MKVPKFWEPRDNGGVWWEAYTPRLYPEIVRDFREERAAGLLYEVVGAMEQTLDLYEGRNIILLQLRVEDPRLQPLVDVSLSDMEIGLLDPIQSFRSITNRII